MLLRCGRDGLWLRQAAGDHRVAHGRTAFKEIAKAAMQAVSSADAGQRGDVDVHLQAKKANKGSISSLLNFLISSFVVFQTY